MQVRTGYKQSGVGEIPNDWEAKRLGDGVDLISGHHVLAQYCNTDGRGTPYLTGPADFNEGAIRVTKFTVRPATLCRPGDILVTVKGSGAGSTVLADGEYCISRQLMAIRSARWDVNFLHETIRRNSATLSAAATGLIPGLSREDLLGVQLAIPPLEEQRAVSAALGDVDALLAGLDRLIVKKRDLKQAAMQQLLTGQTRLPGFQGEWEVKRLGELADMGSGGTPLSSVPAFYGGGIPWVSIADMTSSGRLIAATDKTLTSLGVERSAAQLFPPGTVLYAMYASIGECCIAGVPVTTSQAILGIRPKQRLVGEFLYYFLISMKATVKTLGQQGTQANLNKGIVQDFRIALPSFEEQMTIAAVLSDMDAELTALEARRDKTRALKHGMMQELLTGRTRLV